MVSSQPSRTSDIFVIQHGDSQKQVHRDITTDQAIEVVSKLDARVADELRVTNERIAAISREIITDPDRTVEYYLLEYSRSQVVAHLDQELENLTPEEQQKKIDEYHRYSTIGSALLYSDVNFGGRSKFFPTTWPNFKWWPYRFNDRASSAKAWGVNILYEHTWFRGRRLNLIGIPYVQFEDLSVFGFDNIGSSKA